MEKEDTASSPERLMKMAMGFQASRVLLTAHELGVFQALADGPRDSGFIAKSVNADPRATDRLLNALCALDLLKKDRGLFQNTAEAQSFLVPGKPGFLGGLGHSLQLWESWSTLTEAVKKGRSVFGGEMADRDEAWMEPFIRAMHWRGVQNAPKVASMMEISPESRILDVGGGSGAYAMEFCRTAPCVRATVLDLPRVTALAREYIVEQGLEENVEVLEGDYLQEDFPAGYDLVFLSAIIHINSPAQNVELFEKCRRALVPGGKLVVQDFIMDPDRTAPAFGALFALNMLVGTREGDTYTGDEVASWMEQVGLENSRSRDTGAGTVLVWADKPI